jgi:hypothetical protein
MSSPITSPDLLSEIAALSAKAIAGTITDAELKRGLALLRQERISIKPKAKAKADGDAELESLLSL